MDTKPPTAGMSAPMPDHTDSKTVSDGTGRQRGESTSGESNASSEAPVVERIDRLIGCTPMLKLNRVVDGGPSVFVKLESANPSGSIRDRYLAEILVRAVEAGQLRPGDTVAVAGIDDCSVAASFLAGRLGLDLRVFASENASRRLLELVDGYGADIEWLESGTTWREAVEQAAGWARRAVDRMFVNGYRREAVRDAYATVADEILEALADRPLGAFVTSVTTGGAYRQVTGELRETHPEMLVGGAVLTDKTFPSLDDEDARNVLVDVDIDEAWEMRDRLARREGLLVGPKGAAAVEVAVKMRAEVDSESAVVALNPDAGQRYLGWEEQTSYELDRGP